MKKVLAVIFVAVLILQAGVLTVFAQAPDESSKEIIISDIGLSQPEGGSDTSSTDVTTHGLSSADIEIVDEEWSCPDEIVISGDNIEIKDGKYSYKLTLRSNGTLTFDNDLEIYYQGINGRYQLNYEIDETDNHIMIVTGTFENIIIASPLLEKLSDKNKEQIISRISEDTYFYQLVLLTADGFTFTNTLKFLFDSKPLGYSLNYAYDLLSDKQRLFITLLKPEDSCDSEGILGDTDGDGTVSIIDASYIQRRLANLSVPDCFNEKAGYVNGVKALDITNVTFIQRWLANIPVPYRIGEIIT